MKFETLEFWKQVKLEYETRNHNHFSICFKSPTFLNAWENNKRRINISIQSKVFLDENDYREKSGDLFLFRESRSKKDAKIIRKEFIDWCIERLILG